MQCVIFGVSRIESLNIELFISKLYITVTLNINSCTLSFCCLRLITGLFGCAYTCTSPLSASVNSAPWTPTVGRAVGITCLRYN